MIITHGKNDLCNISFFNDVPEGLSAPPWSPGAQSIIAHDIICYGNKKQKTSKALAPLWGLCN